MNKIHNRKLGFEYVNENQLYKNSQVLFIYGKVLGPIKTSPNFIRILDILTFILNTGIKNLEVLQKRKKFYKI